MRSAVQTLPTPTEGNRSSAWSYGSGGAFASRRVSVGRASCGLFPCLQRLAHLDLVRVLVVHEDRLGLFHPPCWHSVLRRMPFRPEANLLRSEYQPRPRFGGSSATCSPLRQNSLARCREIPRVAFLGASRTAIVPTAEFTPLAHRLLQEADLAMTRWRDGLQAWVCPIKRFTCH